MVQATFLCHILFASSAFSRMLELHNDNIAFTAVQASLLVLSSWLFADFGSGVLHWSVDNYGNGKTPIMGSIIAAFQGHHSAPWTITERGFCNNVHKLTIPFGPLPMGMLYLLLNDQHPSAVLFLTVFCCLEILSQEFHKWSHQLKSQVPDWVNNLQQLGITIARGPHAQHHLAPYDGNYCIISGVCNPVLDESGFFRRLEHIIYNMNGVESNAWKLDAELRERTLRGDYGLVNNKKLQADATVES
jgi:ubiquitin-conjugating enzyme E2 variant